MGTELANVEYEKVEVTREDFVSSFLSRVAEFERSQIEKSKRLRAAQREWIDRIQRMVGR